MSANDRDSVIEDPDKRRTIQSVDRACSILVLISNDAGGSTVSDLARQLSVHKSTISRLLAALENAGMVERDSQTGRFHLGLQILKMSGVILGRLEVLRIADPALRRLAEATQETVNLAIRFKSEAINIAQIPGSNILRSIDWTGKTTPLHRGAAAKALLAHLDRSELECYLILVNASGANLDPAEYWSSIDEIRLNGFAVNRGETNREIYAVGAPVFDSRGRCCASVSIAGYRSALSDTRIAELAPQVVETAAIISRQLGHPVGRFAAIV